MDLTRRCTDCRQPLPPDRKQPRCLSCWRVYYADYLKRGGRKKCSACGKPKLDGRGSPYCVACQREYDQKRGEKRRALCSLKSCKRCGAAFTGLGYQKCEACRGKKPGKPLVPCEACGVLHKKRTRWNCLCADCQSKRKPPPREFHCACGGRLEDGRKKRCADCSKPKPALCENCGVEVKAPALRCKACRRKKEAAKLAERERQRTAKRRASAQCKCGSPLAVKEGRLEKQCAPCREQSQRDERRQHDHKRRARKKAAPRGPVSIRALWAEFRGKCPLCNTKVTRANGHVDHIIPLARGGTHSQENLQILCGPCNVAKGTAIPSGQFRLL